MILSLIWILSMIYCFWKLFVRYNKQAMPGGIGVTPGLDAIMVVLLAPLLAIVDIILTWIRIVREYEKNDNNRKKIL